MELFSKLFGRRGAASTAGRYAEERFPPAPKWRPTFAMPRKTLIDRFAFYMNEATDFVVFQHGTCVMLENGLYETDAADFAKRTLERFTI